MRVNCTTPRLYKGRGLRKPQMVEMRFENPSQVLSCDPCGVWADGCFQVYLQVLA